MLPKKADRQRFSLCQKLGPQNHLLGLAKVTPWQVFKDHFQPLYAASSRSGKPFRLMVGLLILRQLENLSSERIVETWGQNPYFQAFCGQQRLIWKLPCDPPELTYFRRRIGEDGVRNIFEVSVALRGDKAKEAEAGVYSTLQEKNITFPTDTKLLNIIVTQYHTMAKLEEIKLRRSYQREIKSLLWTTRFKSKSRWQDGSQRAVRRLWTIASILVRELKRMLSPESLTIYQQSLDLYGCLPRQQRSDIGNIYSLHEPGVSCISKGKAHKKYEFGTKASVTATKTSRIFVGALPFQDNPFDGHTLPAILSQVESIVVQRQTMEICDRRYRGKRKVGVTSVEIPGSGERAKTASNKRQAWELFCRGAAIEPTSGHPKNDHRMLPNYLKGPIRSTVNLFIACAALNSRDFIRILSFCASNSLDTYFDPMFSRCRLVADMTF